MAEFDGNLKPCQLPWLKPLRRRPNHKTEGQTENQGEFLSKPPQDKQYGRVYRQIHK